LNVEKSRIHGSIHGPGYSARKSLTSGFTLPQGPFSDGFHVFAVDWEPQSIRFFVDDELYATRTPADLPAGSKWVFDHPFFIILNLAVGGGLCPRLFAAMKTRKFRGRRDAARRRRFLSGCKRMTILLPCFSPSGTPEPVGILHAPSIPVNDLGG
jgi:glycosyl hydrolase family 16